MAATDWLSPRAGLAERVAIITLFVVLILLGLAFLAVGLDRADFILCFLGEKNRNAALSFLGVAMGGALLALNAWASHRRAEAMQRAAEAQGAGTNEQALANKQMEDGRRQERLKNAIEHLGHHSAAVRLGGQYELYNLALADDTQQLRQTVFDIFCAYIRQTTSETDYQVEHETKPSSEIQHLLTLLFVRESDVFKGFQAELQGSWLHGVDLRKARLSHAYLSRAHLCHAKLLDAHLEIADLSVADLRKAELNNARLREANLLEARMHECNLSRAKLQGASLWLAELPGACLYEAQAQGACLVGAKAHGADLRNTGMQGAHVSRLELQEATLGQTHFHGADCEYPAPDRIKFCHRITRQSTCLTNLTDVVFSGPGGKEGAIEGSYSAEQASEWVEEHKNAMCAVPRS